jgi:hypothetical protein
MNHIVPLNFAVVPFNLGPVATGTVTWTNGWIAGLIVVSLFLLSLAGVVVAVMHSKESKRERAESTRRVVWIESRIQVRVTAPPWEGEVQTPPDLQLLRAHSHDLRAVRHLH